MGVESHHSQIPLDLPRIAVVDARLEHLVERLVDGLVRGHPVLDGGVEVAGLALLELLQRGLPHG